LNLVFFATSETIEEVTLQFFFLQDKLNSGVVFQQLKQKKTFLPALFRKLFISKPKKEIPRL
jgi:hypothetical protein